MSDDRQKRLQEKLKKCMALSKSNEPHEAAAALRQAQKIMRELGITEDDLDSLAVDTADTLVKTREGFGNCRTMTHLTNMLRDVFAVRPIFERNPGSARRLNVRYVGPRGRVQLAEYSHKVIWRAMQASWDDLLIRHPEFKGDGGKRQAFHIGWLKAVRKQVEAIAPTEAESKGMDRRVTELYPMGTTQGGEFKKKSLDGTAFVSGLRAAQGFALHRPMEEEQTALEHMA